jgi:hypothetical protein
LQVAFHDAFDMPNGLRLIHGHLPP